MPGMPPSVGADLPFVSLLLAPSGCRSLLGCPRHEPCQLVPLGLPSSFVTSNTAPGTQPGSPLSPCQPWVPALPPSPWEGTAASLGTPGTAAAASLGTVPVSVPSLAAPPAAAEGLGQAVLGRGGCCVLLGIWRHFQPSPPELFVQTLCLASGGAARTQPWVVEGNCPGFSLARS